MLISSVRENFSPKIQNKNTQIRKNFSIPLGKADVFQPSFSGKIPEEPARDIALFTKNAIWCIEEKFLTTAEAHLRKAHENTAFSEIHFLRGFIEGEKAKTATDEQAKNAFYQKAEEHYQKAIKTSGNNQRARVASYLKLSDIHEKRNEIGKAVEDLDNAINSRFASSPKFDNPEIPFVEFTNKNQLAMETSSELSERFCYKACLEVQQNKREDAVESCLNSVKQNFSNYKSHSVLGSLYNSYAKSAINKKEQTKLLKQTEKHLWLAQLFAPKKERYIKNLLDFHLSQKNLKKAIKDYTKLINLNPENPENFAQRGFLYLKIGQNKKSFKDFSFALSKNPTYELAQKITEQYLKAKNKGSYKEPLLKPIN